MLFPNALTSSALLDMSALIVAIDVTLISISSFKVI